MDGALTDEELSDEANAFAAAYFDFETGMYLRDYHKVLCEEMPSEYHVADTWANYELMRGRIDVQFDQWRRGVLPSTRK